MLLEVASDPANDLRVDALRTLASYAKSTNHQKTIPDEVTDLMLRTVEDVTCEPCQIAVIGAHLLGRLGWDRMMPVYQRLLDTANCGSPNLIDALTYSLSYWSRSDSWADEALIRLFTCHSKAIQESALSGMYRRYVDDIGGKSGRMTYMRGEDGPEKLKEELAFVKRWWESKAVSNVQEAR
jgi:hypothetical protein